jgi:hypothetical protein
MNDIIHKCSNETMIEMFIHCWVCSVCLHPPKVSKYELKPEAEKIKRGGRPEPN